MCESSVYSRKGSLLMEDVLYVNIDGVHIELRNILNQKKELIGKIDEIDLENHRIYVNLK